MATEEERAATLADAKDKVAVIVGRNLDADLVRTDLDVESLKPARQDFIEIIEIFRASMTLALACCHQSRSLRSETERIKSLRCSRKSATSASLTAVRGSNETVLCVRSVRSTTRCKKP